MACFHMSHCLEWGSAFNFVLKEICMIHVLSNYQGNLIGRTDLHLHRIHISCLSYADVLDIKYILFSLLNLEKMSLVGHYFIAGEVHIPKDTTELPFSHC